MNLTLNPPSWSVRRFAVWLLSCMLSFAIAACGGGGSGDPVVPPGTAPSITTQPASASVTAPATATFSVVATGSDPLSYQWSKNGTAIAGATGASYTTPATVAADTGALFTVAVTNAFGSLTSAAATMTVGQVPIAPTPTLQPLSQTVTAPATATFTAAFTGTAPITYQWTRNGVAIAGATSTTYTTPATTVAADNNALFAVTATNAGGHGTSTDAKLTVNPTPTGVTITMPPNPQTVAAGATATFAVAATGDAPLSYQWFRNGTAIGGATAASYTTAATVAADSGALFKVTVTNPVNNATSTEVALTVTPTSPPEGTAVTITTQPADANPVVGAAASFSVATTGTAPITYQWVRDEVAIAGATAATYTIASVASTDNGAKFKVTASNAVNSVTSRIATLSITPTPPVITGQPMDVAVVANQTATFSVTVTGTSPFTYQWRKNGTAIAGATAASYTTPATTTADNNALFTVVVSNNAPNGSVTSSSAKLTVGPFVPAAIDTQPTGASTPNGMTATFTITAHGTAPLGYQWKKNGTAIPSATASSYTTPVVSFADDQASYTVVVSNTATNGVTSSAAVLTVTLPSTPVRQVSAGYGHSAALRSSGAIYSWGQTQTGSAAGYILGAGEFNYSAGAPVRARNIDNTPFLGIASVSAGTNHSVLIKSDGTIWAWGFAYNGTGYGCPIGDGTCQTRYYPTQVKDASGIPFVGAMQVAAGNYYSVVVKTDGSVWSWGQNTAGYLGDGSTTQRLNPVQVTDPTTGGFFSGATAVAANLDHAMALKSGTVYAWGGNSYGQIGDGSTSAGTSVPKKVEITPGIPLTGITAIAAGERHSVALKSDGTVYAWGYNANGALGDGTTTDRLRATVMRDTAGNPITGVTAIAAGQNFTILLKSDGTLLSTGQNDIGQLGDNSTAAYQINPVPVRDAAGAVFGSVAAICSYHEHTVVYRTDDTVWAWGLNDSRQLGDTTNVNRRNPVPAPAYVP